MEEGRMVMPAFIQLIPGEGDTMESWFKVGGADAIADQLLSTGKTRPCIITTSKLEFMQNAPQMPGMGMRMKTLRADDFATWAQRRRALTRLLIDLGKEPAPSFPNMGGFGGGGFPGGGGGFPGGGGGFPGGGGGFPGGGF